MTRVAVVVLLALAASAPGVSAQTCTYRGTPQALTERPSPLDSVRIELGDDVAWLCYGRPSARGRAVIGVQDPYGAPWRLGANEPTTLHLPFTAEIGGVVVQPGSYSLYAIPGERSWTIVVNGNIARWGIPIDVDVRAADIGSFSVPVTRTDAHVERLEFTFESRGSLAGELVFAWEWNGFRIPVARR